MIVVDVFGYNLYRLLILGLLQAVSCELSSLEVRVSTLEAQRNALYKLTTYLLT